MSKERRPAEQAVPSTLPGRYRAGMLTRNDRQVLAARMSPGAVTTIVRKGTARAAKSAETAAKHDLELFRARAYALRLRGEG